MQITVDGPKTLVDDELTRYATKQIKNLEKLLGPSTRQTATAEITFNKFKTEQSCKLRLTLPQDRLEIEETTVNAYAAVDIVRAAMKQFILDYRRRYGGGRLYHRLRIRLNRL